MKKLFSILALTSTLILSGCGLSPMIVKEADEKPINGFDVHVSNFNKITDRKINLTFVTDKEGEIEPFPWNEIEQDVKEKLKNQGIVLSPEGRPVTVELNKFRGLGSETAFIKNPRSSMVGAGGIIGSLGGSIGAMVVANAVDKKVASDKANNATGENSENRVPEVEFTIKSDNYISNVRLDGLEAIYSYIHTSKRVTVQAISEFFTPKNN